MKGVGGLAPPPVEEEEEEAAASASHHHVIFIIERACLETAKVGASHRLLNCDDHQNYISRKGRDPAHYRPDICHQSLLAVLDSPLNKAGKVKAVFVRTEKNVLIRVSPTTRVPRTFKRFSGLICQLLYKLSIRATNGPDKLMRLVKGPVTRHLPANCQVIGLSRTAPAAQRASQLVGALEDERPVAFVVGGFSHGQIEIQYADREVSISEYPLSAACCIAKLTSALEEKWGIA
ncbi:unnamed protein product [Ostreobium quekettii]|uniref:Ribosomal RNA small subunit methyltransferase NEP1 n=1 Tax=Ostreobium quekettii TaxID=121088 RepID=A0A8S1J186_9CHLO|nr:unnamed protein product [Ostreobium quekettii]